MLIRLIAVLGLVMSLAGCVPLAFVAGGAAAGTSVAKDSRTIQTIADDTDATFQANSKLQADTELAKQAHVTANVYNHVLLLTGQAPTQALRVKAANLVRTLPHVERVYNQIMLGQPIGSFARSNDVWTTTNVKARLVANVDIKTDHFKVVTEDGTVYLMGLATQDQTERAVKVIQNTVGVKRIVKLVQIVAIDPNLGDTKA